MFAVLFEWLFYAAVFGLFGMFALGCVMALGAIFALPFVAIAHMFGINTDKLTAAAIEREERKLAELKAEAAELGRRLGIEPPA